MMRSTLTLSVALAAILLTACSKSADNSPDAATGGPPLVAAPPPATPAAPTAADFVTKAAGTDMFEIAEAKLALKTSKSGEVKKFAMMMVADHTKSTAALKAAIAKSGQTFPLPASLPVDLQAKVDALKGTAAGDFDKAYETDQVAAHREALRVMQTFAAGGDIAELKTFAVATAAVVQKHLDAANTLQSKTS